MTENHFAENIVALFQSQQSATAKSGWVEELRNEGFKRFSNLGWPSRRDEEWKYTSVKAISESVFNTAAVIQDVDASALASVADEGAISLVFVDGHFSKVASKISGLHEGVDIRSLKNALSDPTEDIKGLIKASTSIFNDDAFAALNSAFLGEGLVIQIGRNVVVKPTINVIFLNTPDVTLNMSSPRLIVVSGESSEAQIVETYVGDARSSYFTNTFIQVFLNKNAKLNHSKVQAESSKAFHVGRTFVSLARDATYDSLSFTVGSALCRNDIVISLDGEGAHAELNGLYLASGKQHVDHHTSVFHRVPRASSSQLYKGILTESGRAVFNGKVFVCRDAQETIAFQLNKNLLLSVDAEINTKPELQIDADDVKCTHGATVGQLNPDEMFYLQSRGIPKEDVHSILCHAFADDVVLRVKNSLARAQMSKFLTAFFAE